MRSPWLAAGLLVVAIGLVYGQVAGHDFVEYDDGLYITENARVQEGLTLANAAWAVVTLDPHIWHPLTWLSYLVDGSLWGTERAGPWLLTNVAWHAAAALMLWFALHALGAPTWPSAFAAALFALHPLQTEAVAWASARKEVLSGFLLFATLALYGRYAQRRDHTSYAAVLAGLLLCLSAKGTHVALPFLLLLLDVWPLRRLRPGEEGGEPLRELVLEKLPLLGLSLAVLVLQVVPVSGVYGPWVQDPPLVQRAMDGIWAYAATLGRFAWPDALAIIHPTRTQMGLPPASAWATGGVLAALLAVTALAFAAGRERRYLLVGWLWFVGMLFPMIGLVPSGMRVMHDRYAYVPMVGLAIVAAFGTDAIFRRLRVPRAAVATAAVALLVALGAVAARQAAVWRDSLTLFDHALAVTQRNAIVHYYRGNTLAVRRDLPGAIDAYEAAIAIYPPYPAAREALGRVHLLTGHPRLALPHLQIAVQGRPTWSDGLLSLGRAEWALGATQRAIGRFEAALAADPHSEEARRALAEARAHAPAHR